jgi:hypothetical protein
MGRRLTTAGWTCVGASVAGASHERRGVECQDAHAVVPTASGFMIAVADGAGSAPRAAEGAQLAVAAAAHWVTRGVTDPAALLSRARSCLRTWAADRTALREMATTLSVIVLNRRSLRVAQIGDGAVVVTGADGLTLFRADDRAEYLNETVFVTSDGWRAHVRTDAVPAAGVTGVAAFTDGLQLLALDMRAAAPHVGFFDPVFRFAATVAACGGGPPAPSPTAELAAFLASPRVRARTDDDTTLVVAARPALAA